jgi:hypothetical protein
LTTAFYQITSGPACADRFEGEPGRSLFIRLASNEYAADYTLVLSKGRKLRLGYDLEYNKDAFDNGWVLSAGRPCQASPFAM